MRIVKKVDFGVYLAEEEDQENRVLLPVKQVPEGAKTGDELEVFLYKDSKDPSHCHHSGTLYYAWKGGKAESKRSDKDWCIS